MVVIDGLDGPPALLEFTYITNPGAAWSLFSDYPEALTFSGRICTGEYILVSQASGAQSHATPVRIWGYLRRDCW